MYTDEAKGDVVLSSKPHPAPSSKVGFILACLHVVGGNLIPCQDGCASPLSSVSCVGVHVVGCHSSDFFWFVSFFSQVLLGYLPEVEVISNIVPVLFPSYV